MVLLSSSMARENHRRCSDPKRLSKVFRQLLAKNVSLQKCFFFYDSVVQWLNMVAASLWCFLVFYGVFEVGNYSFKIV